MSDDGPTLSVAELAEYCRTQARLLTGRRETIGAETDALLDEVDEDIAELRSRLAGRANGTDPSAASPPAGSTGADEVAALEELEADIEAKQAAAEANRTRMELFDDLSAAYVDLASEVESLDDVDAALDRVLRFEREHDAPAYFEERLTVLEAASEDGE